MLQNFGGGGATFRCFITAYRPQLNPYGPETRPGGRPGPWGACYVLRRYMPFSVDGKGLRRAMRANVNPATASSLRSLGARMTVILLGWVKFCSAAAPRRPVGPFQGPTCQVWTAGYSL